MDWVRIWNYELGLFPDDWFIVHIRVLETVHVVYIEMLSWFLPACSTGVAWSVSVSWLYPGWEDERLVEASVRRLLLQLDRRIRRHLDCEFDVQGDDCYVRRVTPCGTTELAIYWSENIVIWISYYCIDRTWTSHRISCKDQTPDVTSTHTTIRHMYPVSHSSFSWRQPALAMQRWRHIESLLYDCWSMMFQMFWVQPIMMECCLIRRSAWTHHRAGVCTMMYTVYMDIVMPSPPTS